MTYVNDCFQNHTLFHKVSIRTNNTYFCPRKFPSSSCTNHTSFVVKQALKEAFEVFCNKTVAGTSSAELLAAFCDNILKKGGSEKLSDEAIEETLEKVS